MRSIYVTLSFVMLMVSCYVLSAEGMTFKGAASFLFFLFCFLVNVRRKSPAKGQTPASIEADPDAISLSDEFEIGISIVSAASFQDITQLAGDQYDYRDQFNISALKINYEVFNVFLSQKNIRKYPRVYIMNGSGHIAPLLTAYDGLIVERDTTGLVIQLYWRNSGDEEMIKRILSGFPAIYPIIWVDWRYPCTIDCLNSVKYTGVDTWQYRSTEEQSS